MAKLKITLVKSTIGRKKDQIATVEALGLKNHRVRTYGASLRPPPG